MSADLKVGKTLRITAARQLELRVGDVSLLMKKDGTIILSVDAARERH